MSDPIESVYEEIFYDEEGRVTKRIITTTKYGTAPKPYPVPYTPNPWWYGPYWYSGTTTGIKVDGVEYKTYNSLDTKADDGVE